MGACVAETHCLHWFVMEKKNDHKKKKSGDVEGDDGDALKKRVDSLEGTLQTVLAEVGKANQKITALETALQKAEKEQEFLLRHLKAAEEKIRVFEGTVETRIYRSEQNTSQQLATLQRSTEELRDARNTLRNSVRVDPPWSGSLVVQTSSSTAVASSGTNSGPARSEGGGGFISRVVSYLSPPRYKVLLSRGEQPKPYATLEQLNCVRSALQSRSSNLAFLDSRANVDAIIWVMFSPGGRVDHDASALEELRATRQSELNASALTIGLVVAAGSNPVFPDPKDKPVFFDHCFCFNLGDDFQSLKPGHLATEEALTKLLSVLTK